MIWVVAALLEHLWNTQYDLVGEWVIIKKTGKGSKLGEEMSYNCL